MPRRSKKPKTKHHSFKPNGDLSQAEIWDDSALIRSWNDAVAEYEYYHSIHARGEDVEEILRRAENGELDDDDDGPDAAGATEGVSGEWHDVNQKPMTAQNAEDDDDDDEIEDGEVDDSELTAAKAALSQKVQIDDDDDPEHQEPHHRSGTAIDSNTTWSGRAPPQPDQHHNPSQTSMPTIGPNLPTTNEQGPSSSSSADQTLENVKMAYYWAGYYSGLYDGQRQAQAPGAASTENGGPS
ncbi:hypothetical protein RBB50_001263 [Rhinocladiella similis]